MTRVYLFFALFFSSARTFAFASMSDSTFPFRYLIQGGLHPFEYQAARQGSDARNFGGRLLAARAFCNLLDVLEDILIVVEFILFILIGELHVISFFPLLVARFADDVLHVGGNGFFHRAVALLDLLEILGMIRKTRAVPRPVSSS